MRQSEEILKRLKQEGEALPVPNILAPERMRDMIMVYESMQKQKRRRRITSVLGAVACFCLTMGAVLALQGRLNGTKPGLLSSGYEEKASNSATAESPAPEAADDVNRDSVGIPVMTYEEIYEKMSAVWDEQDSYARTYGEAEAVAKESAVMSDMQKLQSAEKSGSFPTADASYGTTNVQVASVDEADRIKNDGRYLYQIAWKKTESGESADRSGNGKWGIQILDTQNGLAEAAFLADFNRIEEFYVWEDLLIAIENKDLLPSQASWKGLESFKRSMDDVCIAGYENVYHEISVYDIKDRTAPKKVKTFTLQGTYESSRISDGYFYGLSQFTARAQGGAENYASYIPTLDGETLEEARIYCPEDSGGVSYLVLVSIDLNRPSSFADSRAVLCGSGTYYVSQDNIYVGEYRSSYEGETEREEMVSDRTDILKFTYKNGKISVCARGEVPGRLEGSFSLDEYDGYLRAVTTVEEYRVKKVTDDRTGEELGYEYGSRKQTNALYVLDQGLRIRGSIEGLAENEDIYSARFLGDRAYFVTFRQTDPLFAADLSDPTEPRVLGELKVTGFSEYLHPWSGNLLLGIGKEADADTGAAQCMKLSMFDLSDPAQIEEAGKALLKDYNYSAILNDHREVLIDAERNLIGFTAEGSDRGDFRKDFVLYSYEDGDFIQKLKVNTYDGDGYYDVRGTYIGNVLYLLKENGTAQAYDLNTGELLSEL